MRVRPISNPYAAIAVAFTMMLPGAALAEKDETLLVSRASGIDGAKGNDLSPVASVSADGRYVAFLSLATNLHPDDVDLVADVFVRDLETHETILVSRASGSAGAAGNAHSITASVSADGGYVAFDSFATNLHPEDTDTVLDVFVRDLETGETILVSRAGGIAGAKGNGNSRVSALSADGRFVTFESLATNLHPDDSDGESDIFVRDLQTHETILVSRAAGADGAKGNSGSFNPAISADGRHVAFSSVASNLHPDDTDDGTDLFVRDLQTHETILVSRAGGADGAKGDGPSFGPSVSADGRYVAFTSRATNLHPDDADGVQDVFVRDLQTHETSLVSRASGSGAKGNDFSAESTISSDGRYVAFQSQATNLHPDDADGLVDVFVRDLRSHEATVLVSRASGAGGVKGDDASNSPALSADGRYAVFVSLATNLHPDDTDDVQDVFVRDTQGPPPLAPTALEIDYAPFDSDGNGVLEPGEIVDVAPVWRNDADVAWSLEGLASDFQGPFFASYTLWLDDAHYGGVQPGESASCRDFVDLCYAVNVDAETRPALHWDATLRETLSDPQTSSHVWSLHVGDSFADVPRSHPFYRTVETLLHHGVSSGCGEDRFCPAAGATRAQMAVFTLWASEGSGYAPPQCAPGAELFSDVPAASPFCPWIEEMSRRGVLVGCGGGAFCPTAPVTRAQAAVYVLGALEGVDYVPPPCGGVFADVPCPSPFANWIEVLAARGVTSGCGGGDYCPSLPITRGQMSLYLTAAFDLTLYGP